VNTDRARRVTYQLVLRGELGAAFGFLFQGMQMHRESGNTVLTGMVTDQSHLAGIIERTQELGLELVSLGAVDEADGDAASGRGAAFPPP